MSGVEIRKGVKLHRKTTKHGSTPLKADAVEKKVNQSREDETWASANPLLSAGTFPNRNQFYYQPLILTWNTSLLLSSLYGETPWKSWPEPKSTQREMPVIGYRGWRVVGVTGKERLQSVNANFGAWDLGVTTAKCGIDRKHPAPHFHCECGLYVLADLAAAPFWYSQTGIPPDVVIGAVVGWGNVIQHGDEGWRAQYARPIAFLKTDVFGEQPLLERVAQVYKLPILERRGLQLLAAEYGERLAST